jgi:hypothetical protein
MFVPAFADNIICDSLMGDLSKLYSGENIAQEGEKGV